MDRDRITRTGARAPGVERVGPLARRGLTSTIAPHTEQGLHGESSGHEGRWQTSFLGKALSNIPALKPYRGKLAVRNFRGGDGDVGIIRSPVRAIALPDNRHEVG